MKSYNVIIQKHKEQIRMGDKTETKEQKPTQQHFWQSHENRGIKIRDLKVQNLVKS